MQFQIIIVCLTLVVFYLLWRLDQLRDRVRRLEFESPLREVMTVQVQLRRAFFSEALKLSDEEIDRTPGMVGGIWLRLEIWKAHYTGDIGFHTTFSEEPLKTQRIYELPTSSFQFPLQLAKHPLFGKAFEQTGLSSLFPPKTPKSQELEVLLSHKAVIVRARAWGDVAGHTYKPSPSDLVIPIREDDLNEYVDRFGRDDPDWLMMTGHQRSYRREGRWASWSITAVSPEVLSWTTARLDKTGAKPTDDLNG